MENNDEGELDENINNLESVTECIDLEKIKPDNVKENDFVYLLLIEFQKYSSIESQFITKTKTLSF